MMIPNKYWAVAQKYPVFCHYLIIVSGSKLQPQLIAGAPDKIG